MPDITVFGIGAGGLGTGQHVLINASEIVVGGRRRLEAFGIEPDRAVVLEGDLSEAFDRIAKTEGRVAVLATGDPGFFGIVRALAERFGREDLLILPAVSSVSEAFAQAEMSWDDAVVVSVHGREPRRAVNVCRAFPKVAVLTSPAFGPAELADALAGTDRTFFVAERIREYPGERFVEGGAAEISAMIWEDPNIVLVYDPARVVGPKAWISGAHVGRGGWALPESAFEHRSGMITKPETRALVLSLLGPGPGDLIWDIGAGSGSVGIECARLGAAALAVERDPESREHVRRNAARHGVYVDVVEGEAPEALDGLPEPDAVFVGGSGGRFEEIVHLAAAHARRAVVLTLVGIERVVPAAEILEDEGFMVETVLLQISRVEGIGPLHRLVPAAPVFIVSGRRSPKEMT